MAVPAEYRVGPHGYIHGWIFVGVPATGAKVFHPQHGYGTVTGHTGSHAVVKFTGGQQHNFERHPGTGPARLEPAQSAPVANPKAFIDSHYGQWRDGMTSAHEKALRFYQSPGFALMNGQLRGLDKGGLKKSEHASDSDLMRAEKASKDLTAAIRKAPPLERDVTVYRGFSADQFGDLRPGSLITDKGFTSTSLTNDVQAVGRARKPATAEITLPKGTRAGAGSSRELILSPGSTFRVISATTRGGAPHYKLVLVPPKHGR